MKRGTPRHPKVLELSLALNLPKYVVVGLLELLWHFAAEFALDGGIGKYPDAIICEALCWDHDSMILIRALVDTGWVDECECHRLRVHDWNNHADQTVQRVLSKRKQTFAACYDDASAKLGSSKLPLPKALSLKPKAGAGARISIQEKYKYMGELETLSQRVVAVIMAAFGDWPQDQVEPSVIKFDVKNAGISLEGWKEIARDAYEGLPPKSPVRDYHKALFYQIKFYLRNKKNKTSEPEWDKEIDPHKQGWTYFLPLNMFRPFNGDQADALAHSKMNDKPEDYARNVKAIEEFNARRAGKAGN